MVNLIILYLHRYIGSSIAGDGFVWLIYFVQPRYKAISKL